MLDALPKAVRNSLSEQFTGAIRSFNRAALREFCSTLLEWVHSEWERPIRWAQVNHNNGESAMLSFVCPWRLIAAATLLAAQPVFADQALAPEGLSAADWSGIRAAYEANRRAAFAVDGGLQTRNPGQAWNTHFDGRGFLTTPDAGGWSWGLQLVSFGRADAECTISGAASAFCNLGQRIEYEWDGALTEWYINDQRGLEHGYTLRERPAGTTGVLHFSLTVRGDLDPRVSANKRDVQFVNSSGAAAVNYNKLTVFDANGVIVPAWFEAADPASQTLRIVVDDLNAVYPITIDPVAHQAYLKASNTGTLTSGDRFGYSVSVSGDTVVVGAYEEDSNATGVNGNQASNSATNAGAVYVFVKVGGVWSQQAYLKASNTGLGDQFGYSVAISGDTVVVGAFAEDSNATGVNGDQTNNSAMTSGAAYVFARVGGVWSQQAYLKASNTEQEDRYGYSVSVSGDIVVVGAPEEDSGTMGVNGNGANNTAFESGAAYVYVRNAGVWSQQAYLKPLDTWSTDWFGCAVGASGDSVVVGARFENSNAMGVNGNAFDASQLDSGAAYVFVNVAGVWSQQAYLKASNTWGNDQFGTAVAIGGDTVVVGAWGEDSNATGVNGNQANNDAGASGAAYVYSRSGGVWSQQAYLKASNTQGGDHFAISVAIGGDVVVVGAQNEDGGATGVNGNDADESVNNGGAAYVFTRNGSFWSPHAYLKASNTGQNDSFGKDVSTDGATVVVGAWSEDSSATGVNGNGADDSMLDSGAAYVFSITSPCTGDLGGDGTVDGADLGVLLGAWGANPGSPADLNLDGVVDGADLGLLLGAWGGCP